MPIVTTLTSPEAWGMDVLGVAPNDVVPEALILSCATRAGSVEGDDVAVRVPWCEPDDTVGIVAEGAPIPENDPDLNETVLFTKKIATLKAFSREQLAQPQAATLVQDALRDSVTKAADRIFLNNPTPVPPAVGPAGILEDTIEGGVLGANLDKVTDAVALIEGAGGQATHIITSPAMWSTVSKMKTATGSNASLVGAGTEAAQRRLLGLPVLTSSAMPAGELAVINKNWILSALGVVQVARSEHAYFGNDSVGIRVIWRIGFAAMRLEAVVKITTV